MPRKITLAAAAGFCFGVKKAIDVAEQMDQAYIFGSLIHNPQEVARLDKAGKHIVNNLDDVQGNAVVITAHGLDVHKIDEMKARGMAITDTTCPLVTRIYKDGWKLEAAGLKVVIIGDPKHVEVRGIASRMHDPIVIYQDEDIEKVPVGSRVGVVCQSTLFLSKFDRFVEKLKERCETVEAINTICKPTKDRQNSAKALSSEVDVMVVIGGYNSSNTHKLAEVAIQRLGKENTHHIETAQELRPEWFFGKNHVGVTAGASTPDYLIKEVMSMIERMDEPATVGPAAA
ncbi:MAG: 4-hydroxy-3-methylbut-2-enyl diphosphate reductase [candidate division FCPU426 bacterium]